MVTNSIRPTLSFGLFISLAIIVVALIFHYYFGLKACSLCIIETALFIILSMSLFFTLVHNPKSWGRRIYGLLLTLISIAGVAVSARHAWLESLPKDDMPQCEPLIKTWLNDPPTLEVLQKILHVSDGCTEISFSFLSLSIPELTTLIFSIFLLYSLRLMLLAR